MKQITGQVVNIFEKRIYPAIVTVENGKISRIDPYLPEIVGEKNGGIPSRFILPGFIDAHVHIESSMLIPSEFAKLAVVHGTVGTVSDPHEIANVCGLKGVQFMIENGSEVPFKFNFGAPSCVPATVFETAGASLHPEEVDYLLQQKEIRYLSEMMNFPGVLSKDETVMKKITSAQRLSKPVDGHAPGLRGQQAKEYINAGISTDHECFTKEEALEKLAYGMKIIIREGSAAKNFDALADLLHDHPDNMMFCSDDKHPDSLVSGHINLLCKRAVERGIDLFHVLQAACVNPVLHYKLDVGLLREGDAADFIVVEDLVGFNVLETYINGELVAEHGKSKIIGRPKLLTGHPEPVNNFNCAEKNAQDFLFPFVNETMPVIEALDGQLITNRIDYAPLYNDGNIISDTARDILKIVVVNRYENKPAAISLIKNFGLTSGALASSVAHDSHNIVAVGADDESICKAVNLVIRQKGGISCVNREKELVLPLPVAGLMSTENGYEVAGAYTALDAMAKSLGSRLSAPFMTLSFMALLVIPHLKLSDMGLFDGDAFRLV
jgi:adenine deaminase